MNLIRREQILEFIKAKKAVSLKELSGAFTGVSTMTLHRDLDFLEKNGSIERVRGGARYIERDDMDLEPAFVEREVFNRDKKEGVSKKAVGLIGNGSSVYLDSGTTAMSLARLIEDMPLSVITNSPKVSMLFNDKSLINVTLCGGTLNKQNLALYGSAAAASLERINIDTAFIVASGYSEETGFTCGNDGEAVIKNMVVKKARNTVLLIDSSKLDSVLPFTFATLDDIDYIVCDTPLNESLQKEAVKKGIIIL